jgi:hypothetical protein
MEKAPGQILRELKEDIAVYAGLKLELLKLNTYEKAGKVVALLSYGLVILFFAVLTTLFLFLALGLWLGEELNSLSAGFAIVGGGYLMIIGIIACFKKTLTARIMNIVIRALNEEEEKTNDTKTEPDANAGTEVAGR